MFLSETIFNQLVNFPTRISDGDSHSTVLFDLFISTDSSPVAFSPLGNSDNSFISASIRFSSNSMKNAPFPKIAFDYYFADWYRLLDSVRSIL